MRSRPTVSTAKARHGAALTAYCLAGLMATVGWAFSQSLPADALVARVNGIEIRESDVRIADEDFGRSLPAADAATRRERLITFLTDSIILAKAATDQHIEDEADLRRRTTYVRNKALMGKLLELTAEQATTDALLRKAYEELVLSAPREPELRLRVIFVKLPDAKEGAAVKAAEDKAKAALERINGGEDFVTVAAEVTDDVGARSNGGDFGFRTRAEMGKEYAEYAFTLKQGEVAPLIKTSFGWHIIKLEDRRERKPADLEVIRERLHAAVARKAQLDLIARLRSEAKVERQEVPAQPESQAGAEK